VGAAARLVKAPRQVNPRELPVERSDEVGQLARLVRQMYLHGIRGHMEVGRLRRSVDHRIATATRQATAKLRRLAMRDPLTGVANRRFLQAHFGPLFDSCRASGYELACLMIDVDGFKDVNDRLGHLCGDALLTFLGTLLRGCVRRQDYVVRMGGDEFLLLLADCPPERVRKLTQRIGAMFRQHVAAALPADLPVGLSVGIASLVLDRAGSPEELQSVADQRLYVEKATKRLNATAN